MKVNVLVNTNKFTLDEIEPSETVESIKALIFEKFRDVSAPTTPENPLSHTYLSINHLRLLYKGKQLPKLSTLSEHSFKDDDTVLLYISQNKQEDPQDDKNEMIRSTLGDQESSFKYTLTIKNDCAMQAEAPDVDMLEELGEEELDKLLQRLPYDIPAPSESDSPVKFDRSKALPTKAQKNVATFPPSAAGTLNAGPSVAPPTARVAPLTVESYSPISRIYSDNTPIRVKFSQPMVPLDEFDKMQKSHPVPVKVDPQVEGAWAWSDPFTAVFTPASSYPKSTHFFCAVRGDISSAVGGVMRDPVEWTFSTPTLAISTRNISFGGPRVQVLMRFNQEVNDAKVVQSLIVTTDEDEILDVRQLTLLGQNEDKIHHELKKMMEKANEEGKLKEYVLFEIEDDINGVGKKGSVETQVEVCIAPSLLDLEKEIKFKFQTVAALKVQPVKLYEVNRSSLVEKPILYLTSYPLEVRFNNQLLQMGASALANCLSVEPEIPNMKVNHYGNALTIDGEKAPGNYKVTVKTNFVDTFGQSLDEEATLTFPVTAPTITSMNLSVQNAYTFLPYGTPANHENFITLDPTVPPVIHFKSSNVGTLHVRAYAVAGDFDASQYFEFASYATNKNRDYPFLTELWRSDIKVVPPKVNGKKLLHKETSTAIDLSKPFGVDDSHVCGRSKNSHLVVVVRADDTPEVQKTGPMLKRYWLTWCDVGIAYAADETNIYGWAYSLLTGEPLPCTMNLIRENEKPLLLTENKSAAVGGAFTQARGTEDEKFKCLVAKIGTRYSFVNIANLFTQRLKQKYIWHVFDDRAQYRPFDRVYLKGIIRHIDHSNNNITMPDTDDMEVTYTVHDARSKPIINATKIQLKPSYCFNLDFELPGTINLGQCTISLKWGTSTHIHMVDVKEYKRKAFEMFLKKDKSTVRPREPFNLLAYAQAFTGEVLSGTTATWQVSVTPGHYNPPNLATYKFNIMKDSADSEAHEWESERNYSGKHNISVVVDDIITPVSVTCNCTIKDATNETLSASESILIHPTDVYVGVRSEQQLVNFGEPYKLFAITCTPEGKFTGDCALQMYARGIPFETYDGEKTPQDVAVLDQVLTPSEAGPIEVTFEPKFRGKHSITLVATDLNGKTSSVDTEFWVYGPQSAAEKEYEDIKKKEKTAVKEVNPARHVKSAPSSMKLVLDRTESYEAGSSAELLVVAPFWPAIGALYISKNGTILKTEKLSISDSMTRIPIDVVGEYLPGVNIEVVLVGMESRTPVVEVQPEEEPQLKRLKIDCETSQKIPVMATGKINLTVSKDHKKLTLQISPSESRVGPYLPGEDVRMDVTVVGPDGKPVSGAEVTMVVVDESVLALTGYKLKDPKSTFYQTGFYGITTDSTHKNLLLTRVLKEEAPLTVPVDGCITIMYFSGRVLKFEVKNTITIAKLKALVQERDGLPLPTQRLLYKGKQLPDDGTLAEHGVPDGAVINLVLRLFGGGVGDDKEIRAEPAPVIRIRTNMNALAHFGPQYKTGDDGKASCFFVLPDSLTRYRVMALANTIDKFGTGELQITASLPLMLRQAPPRFLNFGDSCVLPVMVQNELDTESEILVGIRAQNVEIATKGWKLKLPAHGRASVPFHVKPTCPGTATFQVAASDSKLTTSDAAQFKFPIHTPTTSEVVASTGVLDGDKIMQQPIARFSNDNVVATAGGLEVSMASTIFQELTDAALYNIQYPYECSEQMSGRIISLVVFKDLLPLLHRSKKDDSPVPDPSELADRIKRLVTNLLERRDSEGNFGYWHKGGDAYDYVSVYAYMAIGLAKQSGYEVPANFTTNAATFLRKIIDRYTQEPTKEEKAGKKRESVSQRTLRWLRRGQQALTGNGDDEVEPDHTLACFAMYVWNEITGDADIRAKEALKMLNRKSLEKMPLEQLAYLLPTVLENTTNLKTKQAAIWEHMNNSLSHTSTAASLATSHSRYRTVLFESGIREQAMLLNTFIACDPKNPNIVKMVRGLMDQRKNGRWYNTQDNSFALMAMHKYFNAYEKNFGNYVADIWVGQGYVGRTEFNGQNTDTHVTQVPMKYLIEEEESSVTLAKKGQGRMYYRMAIEYSPKDLFLPAKNNGFKVSRSYFPVLNENDVVEGKDEAGNKMYTIKAGSLVRIKVEMVADGMRSYVALVDHLPGGLEPQNTARGASGTHTGYSYIYRFWTHQNMRDSRAEVFVDSLYPGLYKYTYIVRAITKGTFLVPPAKAEEMYSPDVFGRSDMMVVNVK